MKNKYERLDVIRLKNNKDYCGLINLYGIIKREWSKKYIPISHLRCLVSKANWIETILNIPDEDKL